MFSQALSFKCTCGSSDTTDTFNIEGTKNISLPLLTTKKMNTE